MRRIEFKMERPGKLTEGQTIILTEGVLPSNYYYSLGIPEDPHLAMSPNIPLIYRLKSKEGVVESIIQNDRGYYVTAVFDEEDPLA